jgi:hypothetical protein
MPAAKTPAKATTKAAASKAPASKAPAGKAAKPAVSESSEMAGGASKASSKITNKKSSPKANNDVPAGKRSFKVRFADGSASGRYISNTPRSAASKGLTQYLRKLKKEGKKIPPQTKMYLSETTLNSKKRLYAYVAKREPLPEPQTVPVPDIKTGEQKHIVYNFRNKITKDRSGNIPEILLSSRKRPAKKVTKKVAKKTTTSTKKPASKTAKKPASKTTKKAKASA